VKVWFNDAFPIRIGTVEIAVFPYTSWADHALEHAQVSVGIKHGPQRLQEAL
jgi:hypothetical protein